MMYLAVNAVFLLGVAAVVTAAIVRARRSSTGGIRWRAMALAGVALLVLTAIFDNVLVGLGIVGYDETRISGVRLGVAPIEDFAYAIAAVLLLPALWHLTARKDEPDA